MVPNVIARRNMGTEGSGPDLRRREWTRRFPLVTNGLPSGQLSGTLQLVIGGVNTPQWYYGLMVEGVQLQRSWSSPVRALMANLGKGGKSGKGERFTVALAAGKISSEEVGAGLGQSLEVGKPAILLFLSDSESKETAVLALICTIRKRDDGEVVLRRSVSCLPEAPQANPEGNLALLPEGFDLGTFKKIAALLR